MNAPKTANRKQSERFIEAARTAECSEDEAVFDEAMKKIAKGKPSPPQKDKK
jgi:hypothetical protein